jgi:hypothetical protein
MACSADSSEPEQEQDAAPATSGRDSAHLLVHGTVTRGDEPVAGARLALTLTPEDLAEIEVGESVESFDAAQVETDEDGRYAIELDPAELSSQYFNGDYLNFDINVLADDELGLWSSTVWLERNEYWRSDDRALPGDEVMDLSFDLVGPTVVLTDSYGETETNDLPVLDAP